MQVESQQEDQLRDQDFYPLITELRNSREPKYVNDQEDVNIVYQIALDPTSASASSPGEAVNDEDGISECIETVPLSTDSREVDCTEEYVIPKHTGTIFIKDALDRGGFGAVYLARLESTKTPLPNLCVKVALRKLLWRSCSDEAKEEERVNNVESLFREASILKCIQVRGGHKNIVNFQFCCTSLDNREVFLGLEYFKGKNLSSTIDMHFRENQPFASSLLHAIMLESADTVQFLQDQGIVHCDIKPHNILFNSVSMKLMFIDFGSAFFFTEKDEEEMVHCCGAGTPEYMAPEILLNGYQTAKPNSDVYCLGLLFYRVLTLERPWHHIREIADARKVGDKDRVWGLIGEQYKCSTQHAETDLQKRIVSPGQTYYDNNSAECKLIKEMLSVDFNGRPSCAKIKQKVEDAKVKLHRSMSRLSCQSETSLHASDSFSSVNCEWIPTTVEANNSQSNNSTSILKTVKDRDKALIGTTTQPSTEEVEEVNQSSLEADELNFNFPSSAEEENVMFDNSMETDGICAPDGAEGENVMFDNSMETGEIYAPDGEMDQSNDETNDTQSSGSII